MWSIFFCLVQPAFVELNHFLKFVPFFILLKLTSPNILSLLAHFIYWMKSIVLTSCSVPTDPFSYLDQLLSNCAIRSNVTISAYWTSDALETVSSFWISFPKLVFQGFKKRKKRNALYKIYIWKVLGYQHPHSWWYDGQFVLCKKSGFFLEL